MTEPLDWARVPEDRLSSARMRARLHTWGRMNERQGRSITSRYLAESNEFVFEAWHAEIQTRSIDLAVPFGDLDSQILAIRRRQLRSQPWRAASIREAMGVPAIFGAVTLVSNLIGSMSMKAMRDELELPPDQRPRLIVRPDPFTIPREFYRATAYNIASRGEADWWIGARDSDGLAISVLNLPPHEVTIEENPKDLRYPIIKWRDKTIPIDDFRQLVFAREPGELRGVGPLQLCGAAVSVSVESQEWAANTYAEGGKPSITIKSASELDPTRQFDVDGNPGTDYSEADLLRNQWINSPANVPRVIDPNIEEIQEFGGTSATEEMLDARGYQVGEVARMFHIPASLLEYAVAGSSITYQNVGMEFEKLLRQCLRPDYMETIEQTMSDLLSRSTVARFNSDALTLADIKTRYEVYGIGIDKGIIDTEEARQFEGLTPGDVENAAVPFSPPTAIPASLPIQLRSTELRCDGQRLFRRSGVTSVGRCNALLALPGEPFVGMCPKCKKVYDVEAGTAVVAPVEQHRARSRRRAQPQQPAPVEVVPVQQGPSEIELLRSMMEHMPERIAAAMPRQEPNAAPVVNFHDGAFRSDAPQVNIPPPVVNVPAPVVNVPTSEPVVNVHTDSFVEAIADLKEMLAAPKVKRIVRDADGRIVGVVENDRED